MTTPCDAFAPDGASRAQQAAKGALVLLLVLAGLWTLHRYLAALAWAAILSIAVWPLFQRTVRRWPPGKHNVLLPALFTGAVAVIFLAPIVVVGFEAASELRNVFQALAQAQTQGIPAPDFLGHLPFGGQAAARWWQQNLGNPEQASALLEQARGSAIGSGSREIGAELAHRVVLFGFTLLTLFFLFCNGDNVNAQLLYASSRAFGSAGERIGRQMIASVHGTVAGLVLVGLGEGVIMGIAYVAVGVPHPTLFGLFTAVAAMVPFGAPVAFGAAAAVLLAQGSMIAAVIIAVLGMTVAFIADHFIRPVLIGGATRLPFLWVLLGILGGVETWGLVGLFLGPAIMAALILLWREWTGRGEPSA